MERRDALSGAVFISALLALMLVLALFKVRVAFAGGKLLLSVAVIVLVVWLLRPRR